MTSICRQDPASVGAAGICLTCQAACGLTGTGGSCCSCWQTPPALSRVTSPFVGPPPIYESRNRCFSVALWADFGHPQSAVGSSLPGLLPSGHTQAMRIAMHPSGWVSVSPDGPVHGSLSWLGHCTVHPLPHPLTCPGFPECFPACTGG